MKCFIFPMFAILASQGPAIAQPNAIPNASFEDWGYDSFWNGNLPIGWFGFTSDTLVVQSTDAHSGMYALGGGVIHNGDSVQSTFLWAGSSDASLGGLSISYAPLDFEGFYKLTSVGNDAIEVEAFFQSQGSFDGGAIFIDSVTTEGGYQYFNVPIELMTQIPDTVSLYISLTNVSGPPHVGSSFVLDDLLLPGSSVVQPANRNQVINLNIWPNPVINAGRLSVTLPSAEHVSLDLKNILGQRVLKVFDGSLQAGTNTVSFDPVSLANGTYFCTLQTEKGERTITNVVIAR